MIAREGNSESWLHFHPSCGFFQIYLWTGHAELKHCSNQKTILAAWPPNMRAVPRPGWAGSVRETHFKCREDAGRWGQESHLLLFVKKGKKLDGQRDLNWNGIECRHWLSIAANITARERVRHNVLLDGRTYEVILPPNQAWICPSL